MEPTPGLFNNPRVRVSLVIALLIVIVAFVSSRPKVSEKTSLVVAKDDVAVGIHKDMDSDGLEEWQENLWGTDAMNSDTDGDGTPDGEEVRIGRNPNVRGPKDRMGEATQSTSTIKYYDDDPTLSTTEVVSRDILSAYLEMKKSGTYSEKAMADLTAQMVDKTGSRVKPISLLYGPNDIRIDSSEATSTYTTYANALGTIFAQFRNDALEDEISLFTRMIEKGDETTIPLLEQISTSYLNISKALIAVRVPTSLASSHLSLSNGYGTLSQAVEKLRNFQKDPLANTEGLAAHKTAIDTVMNTMVAIQKEIRAKGVVLTSTDPGAQVFGIITQ
jgi:hypothetical protein